MKKTCRESDVKINEQSSKKHFKMEPKSISEPGNWKLESGSWKMVSGGRKVAMKGDPEKKAKGGSGATGGAVPGSSDSWKKRGKGGF